MGPKTTLRRSCGFGHASYKACAFEAVDQASGGAAGQAGLLRELSCRHRPLQVEQIQNLDVCVVYSDAFAHGEAEQGAQEAGEAGLTRQIFDQLVDLRPGP
jgi:hypothetical protein